MKTTVLFLIAAFLILVAPSVDLTTIGIPMVEIHDADAGPLSRRMHPQPQQQKPQHQQSNMQGVDAEEKQKCMEMLQSGDTEGARACMDNLQKGGSDESLSGSEVVQEEREPMTSSEGDKTRGSVPIGTIVSSLPGNCDKVVVENISYSRCDDDYYRAAFQGSNLVFVSVEKP